MKLALLAAPASLLAMVANQPDADLSWQFHHSPAVAQVEVLRPATVKDARDKYEVFAALQSLAAPESMQDPRQTTIATLLADPAAHDGQQVRVTGAAVVRFEATYICPTVAMIDAGDSKQCLWLAPGDIGDDVMAYDLRPLHGKIVEVVGRFDASQFGHMGAYGGTIVVTSASVHGSHGKGDVPPPAPEPPRRRSSPER